MYNWKLETKLTNYTGSAPTLHDAIESLVHYSYGEEQRDFYVNGHHMNDEFGLWISGGKVVHDDGSEFVPMKGWYEKLGGGKPAPTPVDMLAALNTALANSFTNGKESA